MSGVVLLSGCSSQDDVQACTAIGMVPGVEIGIAQAAAASTSAPIAATWTAVACTKAGGCETASAVPTTPIYVNHPDIQDSTAIGVTAYAADQSGMVGPAVTRTVSPTLRIDNPTCGPSAYYATITVTPTR